MKFFFFLFLILSCSQKNSDHTTYKMALGDEISSLDPANAYDSVSLSVVQQVYESLYQYKYNVSPYTLEPLLAEDFPQLSEDKKTYTFKIKKNIQYHQSDAFKGQPRFVLAEDFINQIKRLAFKETNSNGWWLFDGKIKGINEFRAKVNTLDDLFATPIEGVKALDDHTIQIELIKPYPQLLFAFSMPFTSPIPKEVIIFHQNILNNNEVGTGPYYLENWRRGLEVNLQKFKSHHQPELAKIEKVKFSIIKEAQTRWLNFLNQKIDTLGLAKDQLATAMEGNQLNKELQKKDIKLIISPTLTYWWISFNMNDKLLGKNLKLRQAIAHCINVDEYIRLFTSSTAQKANSIYPMGIFGYDSNSKLPYNFNLEQAKTLLKEAGYPDGKGLPNLQYDVRGTDTISRQMAEYVKNQLAQIGIRLNINLNTFPAFIEKTRKGQLQLWLDGWSLDYPDAENVLQLLSSKNASPGPNATSYSNLKVDALIDKISTLGDNDEKKLLMEQIQQIVLAETPWIMLYYSRSYVVHHPKLQNYHPSDLVANIIKYFSF